MTKILNKKGKECKNVRCKRNHDYLGRHVRSHCKKSEKPEQECDHAIRCECKHKCFRCKSEFEPLAPQSVSLAKKDIKRHILKKRNKLSIAPQSEKCKRIPCKDKGCTFSYLKHAHWSKPSPNYYRPSSKLVDKSEKKHKCMPHCKEDEFCKTCGDPLSKGTNYFDMPISEKKKLINKAAKRANEMQRETIRLSKQTDGFYSKEGLRENARAQELIDSCWSKQEIDNWKGTFAEQMTGIFRVRPTRAGEEGVINFLTGFITKVLASQKHDNEILVKTILQTKNKELREEKDIAYLRGHIKGRERERRDLRGWLKKELNGAKDSTVWISEVRKIIFNVL